MELVVFDLDGTLLSRKAKISEVTATTLQKLSVAGIAYTVATGRTMHGARALLEGHGFDLPHIYKNGVVTWCPEKQTYSHSTLLNATHLQPALDTLLAKDVSPFVFTVDAGDRHDIYHPPLKNEFEERLAEALAADLDGGMRPLGALEPHLGITNVSALAPQSQIDPVCELVESDPTLIAYSGPAFEGQGLSWLDVHHSEGNKGAAARRLCDEVGASRLICFGDSENDLSMFAVADEAYAPSSAKEKVKAAATGIIGHHDEEGIALFLEQRFAL